MILKIVKIGVLLLLAGVVGSIGLGFGWIDSARESALHSFFAYTMIVSTLSLLLYLAGSYIESKKLITCTGCKLVNYVGNFIIYLVLVAVLGTIDLFLY
jgi:hypothetical protein